MLRCIELFAGAGGLAMGVGLAGFEPELVVEWDRWACDTIRENGTRGYPLVANWKVHEGDVRKADWSAVSEGLDLIAGGPPCQPFSLGGKHKAFDDSRDMFPATVEIVRRLRPKAFILENVKGLTRSAFANYYQYILLQLTFPEQPRNEGEGWFDHFLRLQEEQASGRAHGKQLTYNVVPTLVNAADYGVPQRRERVFIVGFRSDLGIEWSFPRETHSHEALLYEQWVTGEYWKRHKLKRPNTPDAMASRLRGLERMERPSELPWRTVRDALEGLPDPSTAAARKYLDHSYQAGARSYPGHTGSPLDLPAKTLKAGDHGVPGGENMLVKDDGTVRYFTVRESARLQTFPDGYRFHGAWSEAMRQLGNAVPVLLARTVSASVAEALLVAQARAITKVNGRKRNVG